MQFVPPVSRNIDLDEFLARPLFAHLATASDDGARDSPVWYLWEERYLWTLGNRQSDTFPKRLLAEPRCSYGIVDFRPEIGYLQHVGFRGTATIVPVNIARAVRLIRRYVRPEVDLRNLWFASDIEEVDPETSDTIFVRFQPDTAVARDLSYSIDGRALRGAAVFR